MPVEAKPLFRPDALRRHLKTFRVPEAVGAQRDVIRRWADLLAQPNPPSERELLPDFITDVFCGILGYSRPADNPRRYTRAREKFIQVNGKYADAVLGEFGEGRDDRPVIAVEGKGPKDPLDRPFAGRKKSAVEQGYGYAINLPCDWIIVTSMRQTRLLHKGSDEQTFERFDIADLAENDTAFKKFVFLLAADRVVPEAGACHFHALKEASDKVGKDLTKEFYVKYADIRQDMFEVLCRENADADRHDVLSATQKILDRVLFAAFCEDRGLLPEETLKKAFQHNDPYNPRPIWENFVGLFHAINKGNPSLRIPAYNGGLFADDPFLDRLNITDEVCAYFDELGDYEYRPASEVDVESDDAPVVDVEILGHIFEQSITDLEQIRNELDGLVEPVGKEKHKNRRKKEGAFYTPDFITRYIVEQTLGGVLEDRFERLRRKHEHEAKGTAAKVIADPGVYDLDALNGPQRDALVRFWESWQDELESIRILDPACGSGAFLIEAFDQLHAAYESSNERLEELRGHRTLFDLDRKILQENIFGVDINEEAIQICRLSLWIKTAERGKQLTSLDDTIRVGNSVVDDPAIDQRAFDWRAAFPQVFESGGFDVVVGNPPYVRQEWISPIKPHLEANYASYHGMADLYVYFYELGVRLLKPGGLMSYVVTNKWMKAGYGEPLRRFFAEKSWVESVVDFGHAKQIFEQADVFPSIIVARKPTTAKPPKNSRVCAIPREQLRVDDLTAQVDCEGFELPRRQLASDVWRLERPESNDLISRIGDAGEPLSTFAKTKPYRGILTGLNEAFLIDTPTKNALVAEDRGCESLIKRYVRGQDVSRWRPAWNGFWMITIPSSGDHAWPWSDAESREEAETVFRRSYPSVWNHFQQYRDRLVKRQDQGRFWWELRACAYWDAFLQPKVMYQDITWRSTFCLDTESTLCNNTVYFMPTADIWTLGVLNSPIAWWYSWRTAVHGKDEALRFFTVFLEQFPIPSPTDKQRQNMEEAVGRIVELTRTRQAATATITDWLRVEHSVEKIGKKLESPLELDSDEFVAEVKKRRGRKNPLSAAALRSLRDEYQQTIEPARRLAAETLQLELRISDLVNEAYGLTPEDIDLMWKTAPPRMPIPKSPNVDE